MSLVPRNQIWRSPFYEMEKHLRDLHRALDVPAQGHDSLLEGFWSPAVDVIDRADSIILKAELPGLSRDDIEVTIENNMLTIRGEKKEEKEHKDGDIVRSERYYGTFHRAFTLPSTVNPEQVEAKFDRGILELTIGKKEEAKPRQIRVDVK